MLLRDTIYQAIRTAILSCEFQPGQELREQILAERYHVSRSPIRDSLLRLEQENLVTVLPRQGYLVKPISVSDVEDILNLRSLIEPACAAAAARADDDAVRVLDQFRGFADQDRPETKYVEYNESFHCTVADLSGSQRTAALARDLIQQFERGMRVLISNCDMRVLISNFSYKVLRRDCEEHEAIIDAIQAHDADRAFRFSREHTERAMAVMTRRETDREAEATDEGGSETNA